MPVTSVLRMPKVPKPNSKTKGWNVCFDACLSLPEPSSKTTGWNVCFDVFVVPPHPTITWNRFRNDKPVLSSYRGTMYCTQRAKAPIRKGNSCARASPRTSSMQLICAARARVVRNPCREIQGLLSSAGSLPLKTQRVWVEPAKMSKLLLRGLDVMGLDLPALSAWFHMWLSSHGPEIVGKKEVKMSGTAQKWWHRDPWSSDSFYVWEVWL